MKRIPLTQGQFALVDDEDFEWLSRWKWWVYTRKTNPVMYAMRTGTAKETIRMHRLIMNARQEVSVDHHNGNGLDNQKENLRLCTHAENLRNRKKRKTSTSKFKGVSRNRSSSKWRATIHGKGKQVHIGQYRSEIEAARAYDEKAVELFGEYANTNFK